MALQVPLPENYTQFLVAGGLAGARIGVLHQIRWGCLPWQTVTMSVGRHR